MTATVTYRVGRARPGIIRLWSIQPLAVWEQLRRHQPLYVDLSWIDGDQYWERIFDVDTLARGGWWPNSGVQATFERLDLADVMGVTEFTARGRPFPEET